MKLAMVFLASELMLALNGNSTPLRVCDDYQKHVDCHFLGARMIRDLPPDEKLVYSVPSVAFTDKGHVHIVIGNCEIDCVPDSKR